MEITNDPSLTMLEKVTELRELQQLLLSKNVANANRAGYQSESMDFKSLLASVSHSTMELPANLEAYINKDPKAKSIDKLLLESASNQLQHKSLTVLIKSKMQLLQIALKGE